MLARRRSCCRSSSGRWTLLPHLDLHAPESSSPPPPHPTPPGRACFQLGVRGLAGLRPTHHQPRSRGAGSAAPRCGSEHSGTRGLPPRRLVAIRTRCVISPLPCSRSAHSPCFSNPGFDFGIFCVAFAFGDVHGEGKLVLIPW